MDPPLHRPPSRGPRTPGLRRWITSIDAPPAPPSTATLLPVRNSPFSRIPTLIPEPFSYPFPPQAASRIQPGLSESCGGAFRSPRPSPKPGQADRASEDSLQLDIQKLKEKKDMLDKEISQLLSEGYSVDELEDHISQLHEYNDIKDAAQMLLGRLAVIRGVTTKELYPEFGLDMND
uniref:DNA repair protein SWI5 homolog n=1 Tax=Capra hircus TaxID=9925 RepID=A0A8C2SF78_CAPHI